MQETRYFDNDGMEQRLNEIFYEQHAEDSREKLINKMNNRLFELEQQGHSLVKQAPITLSEKLAIERTNKAKKKLKRMNKAMS
jgi:hypothetical protein